IGSTNANRRGLFHDGEINAFTIPQALKAAVDNPARALRTKLWAEHLGLPPALGPVLLDDPIGGFELLRRTHFQGNRVTPSEMLDTNRYLTVPTTTGLIAQALLATAIRWVDSLIPLIWNDMADPTTSAAPQPARGPTPP